MKAANSLVAVVLAEEDLLGERVSRQPVPAQVEISEERQVLKGPEIVPWFQASQDRLIVQISGMQCTENLYRDWLIHGPQVARML